jgi:hypothetical protein
MDKGHLIGAATGSRSWPSPAFLQRRFAKHEQSLAVEAAAEQQQPGRVFAFEQDQRLSEFATGTITIAGATRQQAEMKPGHGECGIEIDRDPITLAGALAATRMLAAKCQNVMGAGIQLVDQKQSQAGVPCGHELSAIGEQRRFEEQSVGIRSGHPRAAANMIKRLDETLLAQEIERRCDIPRRCRLTGGRAYGGRRLDKHRDALGRFADLIEPSHADSRDRRGD